MKGKGFTEFLCCKDEIESLLEEGHSIYQIHKKLSESGKITTKYKNFHRILHSLKMKPATPKTIEHGDNVLMNAYKYIESKKNKSKYQIKLYEYGENKEEPFHDNKQKSNFDIVDDDDLL